MSMIPFIANISPQEKNHWLERLNHVLPEISVIASDELDDDQCETARVAIVANPDPTELQRFTQLIWVQSLWAGVEQMIELPALQDVTIVKMADPELATTMAEAVLTWTLYLHRNIPLYQQLQQQHVWRPLEYVSAQDRTVSVLGTGALGTAAIHRLQVMGFKVLAWSRSAKNIAGIHHFHGVGQLPELLAQTDILVSLLPLTPSTSGLMNEDRLSQLKTGASVINFSRSRIFDYQALMLLLDQRHLQHAVLDVFDQEPLNTDDPLWEHPNITVLPHISGPTSPDTASLIVQTNIRNYLADGTIPKGVNKHTGY
ncbi:2-hydroxyacid dehydrogenase [Gynuella sp.]|uniref:2-hydroxyacid dehydrogenase n=1 Tax=Gynuella sp. TaxID=2969146 RepID=UPI003D0D22FE